MDELVQQLGLAVSNLSNCLPDAQSWSGPAATAFAQEVQELAGEVGALILDLVSGNAFLTIEDLTLG